MQQFAKLFEDEKYGQIVVLLDQDDEGEPCVKFMGQPPGLGICVFSLGFGTVDQAREVFGGVTHEQATAGVASMWKFAPQPEAK